MTTRDFHTIRGERHTLYCKSVNNWERVNIRDEKRDTQLSEREGGEKELVPCGLS